MESEKELLKLVVERLTLSRRFPSSDLSFEAKFVEDLLPEFFSWLAWMIAASPAAALGWFLGGRGLVLASMLAADCGA
jgi:hypothetical protein